MEEKESVSVAAVAILYNKIGAVIGQIGDEGKNVVVGLDNIGRGDVLIDIVVGEEVFPDETAAHEHSRRRSTARENKRPLDGLPGGRSLILRSSRRDERGHWMICRGVQV